VFAYLFWLFCFLFVYLWFVFSCFVVCCCFCDLVFLSLLVFFCFAGTARLSQYSHISLLANKEIRRLHLYRLDSKSTKSTIIQMQKIHCKQFLELARCERVMTTRAEFHFSWLILSLPRPNPCGSEQPIHRERPVATQHPLRNCVDHLAAPSHAHATPRVETGQ